MPMGLYETRSIHGFLERNFLSIKDAFELLGMQDDYEGFLQDCEEEIQGTSMEALRVDLDGFNLGHRSETQAFGMALRHAYILTRLAEQEISDGGFEKPLFLLNEASFYAGLAQGIGWVKFWNNWRPETDSSEATRNAAKIRHEKASDPVKEEVLKLLKALQREEKWTQLTSAITRIQADLSAFLDREKSKLKQENIANRISVWCKSDLDFRKRLSEFVELPAPPSSDK